MAKHAGDVARALSTQLELFSLAMVDVTVALREFAQDIEELIEREDPGRVAKAEVEAAAVIATAMDGRKGPTR